MNLTDLDGTHVIVEPIEVKVAVSDGMDGKLYWLTVPCLKNELVFGVGRTKSSALEMLKELLIKYYDDLMLSNLDRYNTDTLRMIDKKRLQRSIRARTI